MIKRILFLGIILLLIGGYLSSGWYSSYQLLRSQSQAHSYHSKIGIEIYDFLDRYHQIKREYPTTIDNFLRSSELDPDVNEFFEALDESKIGVMNLKDSLFAVYFYGINGDDKCANILSVDQMSFIDYVTSRGDFLLGGIPIRSPCYYGNTYLWEGEFVDKQLHYKADVYFGSKINQFRSLFDSLGVNKEFTVRAELREKPIVIELMCIDIEQRKLELIEEKFERLFDNPSIMKQIDLIYLSVSPIPLN